MSSRLWQEALQAILSRQNKRLAIVGIGHELRGDDAVGVLIVRELQKRLATRDDLLVIDAGVALENVSGQLRRFAPDIVLLIDAVDMHQEAGTIAMIDLDSKFVERLTSTHSLSLRLFAHYLQAEHPCSIYLLGIQGIQTRLDAQLSSSVRSSLEHVVDCIMQFVSAD